jgi:hypothetical protein
VLKVWSPAKYSWGNGGTFKRKGLVGGLLVVGADPFEDCGTLVLSLLTLCFLAMT